MGTVDEGERFFDGLWKEARAVSDPDKKFYEAFGRGRGGVLDLFGPSVWLRGIGAAIKGHGVGLPVGDPLVMPGSYLVQDDRVLWSHDAQHAGDHPDYEKLPGILEAATR